MRKPSRVTTENLFLSTTGNCLTSLAALRDLCTGWLDRAWIPIADDGNNNHCCLDLNPAAGGHVGQIIKVWNESHLRTVHSKSFREWLAVFADLLEVGEFVYSEAHNGLISLEDAAADGAV